MDHHFVARDLSRLDETSADALVCSVWSDARPFAGLAGLVDWRLAGRLSRLAQRGMLTGACGETLCTPGRPRLPFDKVIVVGLGERAKFSGSTYDEAFQRVLVVAHDLLVRRLALELPGRGSEAIGPVDAFAPVAAESPPGALVEYAPTLYVIDVPSAIDAMAAVTEERRHRVRKL